MSKHHQSKPLTTPKHHDMYQSFPEHSSPTPVNVAKYFKLFPYLHEELKLAILSFVADAPFETMPNYPESALTHKLPLISRQFRSICNSDLLWKEALIRITKQEPGLWKDALARISGGGEMQQDESALNLVERTHHHLLANTPNSCSYKSIYKQVVNSHLRFKGPVFCMPGQVALGQTYALHLFEYRYRLLIVEAMRHQTVEARDGGRMTGPPVYFIHANRAPLERSVPAVLVQVVQCQMFADGRADVLLLPLHFMWIERVWVRPDSGHLHYAQCLKMGRHVTLQMNHLQRQEALANAMDRLAGQLAETDGDTSSPPRNTTTEDDDGDTSEGSESENNLDQEVDSFSD